MISVWKRISRNSQFNKSSSKAKSTDCKCLRLRWRNALKKLWVRKPNLKTKRLKETIGFCLMKLTRGSKQTWIRYSQRCRASRLQVIKSHWQCWLRLKNKYINSSKCLRLRNKLTSKLWLIKHTRSDKKSDKKETKQIMRRKKQS